MSGLLDTSGADTPRRTRGGAGYTSGSSKGRR